MMRDCSKCGDSKPLTLFYRHPFGKGGHDTTCSECRKVAVRQNRAARIEYYRAYDRARAVQPDRVEARKRLNQVKPSARTEKDPLKRSARVALGNAVRDGRIKRPPECEVCGAPCDPHGHHDDYTSPLDVIWCCTPCHALIHAYWRVQGRIAA